MSFNTVVFASHTGLAYLWLCFWLGFPLAVLVAWAMIVHKAGFSAWWVAVPAACYLLFVTELFLLFYDVQTIALGQARLEVPASPQDFEVLSWLVVLTGIASVVLFFVFALVRWPVAGADRGRRTYSGAAPSFVAPAGATAPPIRSVEASPSTPSPSVAARPDVDASSSSSSLSAADGAVAVATAPAPGPRTFYCSWCGRERRSDAHAIHHCGSRERPPVFCTACGRGLEPHAEACADCGTSTSQLSPG